MMISLDCETCGLDLHHGAKPYLVTTCDEQGNQLYWEWEVNPLTRQPIVPEEDLEEIQDVIDDADSLVLQNPKFDVAALQTVFCGRLRWDWSKVYDTLLAGHLIASNQPHDLTSMALLYLGENVQPFEDAIRKATQEARRLCQGKHPKYPDWRIAQKGLAEMPSAKGSVWKYDMWLPRAVAKEENYRAHTWHTLCANYANSDSEITLALFKRQRELLKERGLWKIYLERLKVLPIVYEMERHGVTISRKRLESQVKEYQRESDRANCICTNIAKSYGYELTLPKSGNNKSLLEFLFGKVDLDPDTDEILEEHQWLDLPVVARSKKTKDPSLDKDALEKYVETLPKRSKALTFIKALKGKRKRDTALSYMESYQRFWLPWQWPYKRPELGHDWFQLHPSLNPTGTFTLRWSSSNPNEQNISRQEGFNLRYSFGPAPGREWWALDYNNIELRIPAYEAGETEQIELFEKPDEAPYFGSNHLLMFDILHTKRLKLDTSDPKYLLKAKEKYDVTWYQWTKNGDFAVQYGAIEKSGTADRAYHVKGGQRKVEGRFKKVKQLNQKLIAFAEKHGYVETLPDKTVDPSRGYPIYCTRTNYGRILPTVPLNYHVQSTACWCLMKAMIRCQHYLDGLNAACQEPKYFMVMQVHDEIVFDFPFRENKGNLLKVKMLAKRMAQSGDDIGIPLTVGIDYHPKNWSEGIEV